jgi:2-oxoisovalerate dehydrogenase E2 component (dihydrolipoyl transacylase)
MAREFKLPDVGEGLTEADIVSWHVKPGDTVEVNQIIVDIETAKAVVELPSPWDGVVSALLVEEGQTVDVGIPIISIDVAGDAPAEKPVSPNGAQVTDNPEAPQTRTPVLVGYGVRPGTTARRPRKTGVTHPASYPSTPSAPRTAPTAVPPAAAPPVVPAPPAVAPTPVRALAKPPVRRLARDLGIDLTTLTGTGPQGSVTRDDVEQHVSTQGQGGLGGREVPSIGGTPGGRPPGETEQRIPVKGVRKHIAAAMVSSAFTAPHVTEFLQVDVTETMSATRRLRDLPEFADVRVSPLLLVAKALLIAVARHPMINSTWDETAQEIVVKHRVNLGIAVASERGLLVPNVKDAGSQSLAGLAHSLDALASTARAGKATPADLSGGTITITNVGVFGVDAGTPILTPGEAAILAFGQVRDMPWVVDGELAVRKVTTLSLSFDHRIVDGQLGSAALRDVGSMLADPMRLFAWS